MTNPVKTLQDLPDELLVQIFSEASTSSIDATSKQFIPVQQTVLKSIWKQIIGPLTEISQKFHKENLPSKGISMHMRNGECYVNGKKVSVQNSHSLNQGTFIFSSSANIIQNNQGNQLITISGGKVTINGTPVKYSDAQSDLKKIIEDQIRDEKTLESGFNPKDALKKLEKHLLDLFTKSLTDIKDKASSLQSEDLQYYADLFKVKFETHKSYFRNSLSPQRFIRLAKITSKLMRKIDKRVGDAINTFTRNKIQNAFQKAKFW